MNMEYSHPQSNEERRRIERFCLSLPATVSVRQKNRTRRVLSVTTRDVSAEGAFFPCSTPLDPDTKVMVSLSLPSPRPADPSQVRVVVTGSVVRTEDTGMAVRFDKRSRFFRQAA